MKISKVIEGQHNNESFRYDKGKLYMFDRTWDYADIQTLIETANLLTVQGYEVKKPIGTRKETINSIWGLTEIDQKIYEEDN